MNKVLLLVILACLLLCPLPTFAQGAFPSRAEQLVMEDNLLILWSMGLTKSAHKSQNELCRDALFSSSCLKAQSVVWIVMNILVFSKAYLKICGGMCRRMGWKRLLEPSLVRK